MDPKHLDTLLQMLQIIVREIEDAIIEKKQEADQE